MKALRSVQSIFLTVILFLCVGCSEEADIEGWKVAPSEELSVYVEYGIISDIMEVVAQFREQHPEIPLNLQWKESHENVGTKDKLKTEIMAGKGQISF